MCLHALFEGAYTDILDCSNLQVIFVDADQIVRADMGELYDMNLKGRPLAYTPFCDNNKEMDGYRFWKQVHTTYFMYSKVLPPASPILSLCVSKSTLVDISRTPDGIITFAA